MHVGFLTQVEEVVELVRKRDLLALGRHDLTTLKLVQKGLNRRIEHTDAYLGRMLRDIIVETIETSLKPSLPEDLGQRDWRRYILLSEYIARGQRWAIVAERLAVGHSLFYDIKRDAIELLANVLWDKEQEALQQPTTVLHNLPRPPYSHFVRRVDNEGKDYVDRIIKELATGRAWIITISGVGGVGKTALAYEVARECLARGLFEAIIWASAKQQELRFLKGPTSTVEYVTSLSDILDTMGKTLENRKVLTVAGITEKLAAVRQLLAEMNCLIVIDNLETLDEDVHHGHWVRSMGMAQ